MVNAYQLVAVVRSDSLVQELSPYARNFDQNQGGDNHSMYVCMHEMRKKHAAAGYPSVANKKSLNFFFGAACSQDVMRMQ